MVPKLEEEKKKRSGQNIAEHATIIDLHQTLVWSCMRTIRVNAMKQAASIGITARERPYEQQREEKSAG